MPRYSFVVALACLAVAGSAMAVPPNNGYIGAFGDAGGTNCCITLNGGGNGRVYFYMVTAGATAAGFNGVEFRAAIQPSATGVSFAWNPVGGAGVVMGDPIDNGSGGGVYMFFPSCQTLTGLPGDRILLGNVLILGMTTEHQISVRSHSTPSSPNFECPSVQLCDGPAYTQVCLTLEQGDPALGGDEPVAFTSAVNSASCAGASCGFVAVEPTTWTRVKNLYHF